VRNLSKATADFYVVKGISPQRLYLPLQQG